MIRNENATNHVALPTPISTFLRENAIKKYEIVQFHAGKKRYCIRLKKNNKELLLKWNDKGNRICREMLDKERKIYELLQSSGIAPELEGEFSPWFVMEYLPFSSTFLDTLQICDLSEVEHLVGVLLGKYQEFNIIIRRAEQEKKILSLSHRKNQAKWFLGGLLNSGFMGRDNGFWEKKRNRFIWRVVRNFMLPVIFSRFVLKDLIVHGDFHLNNVLITPDGEVRIIDYEDVGYGSIEVELVYFYVQLWVLRLRQEAEIALRIEESFANMLVSLGGQSEAFWALLPLFKAAIYMNSRYREQQDVFSFNEATRLWKKAIQCL